MSGSGGGRPNGTSAEQHELKESITNLEKGTGFSSSGVLAPEEAKVSPSVFSGGGVTGFSLKCALSPDIFVKMEIKMQVREPNSSRTSSHSRKGTSMTLREQQRNQIGCGNGSRAWVKFL